MPVGRFDRNALSGEPTVRVVGVTETGGEVTVSATLLNWETQTLQVQAHADRPTVVGLALKHRSPHRPES
jgi:hypothetical protein